jgi:hypothetical protein
MLRHTSFKLTINVAPDRDIFFRKQFSKYEMAIIIYHFTQPKKTFVVI